MATPADGSHNHPGHGARGETGKTGAQGIPGPSGPAGSDKIVLLVDAFNGVRDALHQDRRDRRWLAGIAAMILLLGLFVIADARRQTKANGRMGAIILAVTGCTAEDTPAQCSARVRAASIGEGTRRIIEVDCVTRRALAGIPAPDPSRFCTAQTPSSVYPG